MARCARPLHEPDVGGLAGALTVAADPRGAPLGWLHPPPTPRAAGAQTTSGRQVLLTHPSAGTPQPREPATDVPHRRRRVVAALPPRPPAASPHNNTRCGIHSRVAAAVRADEPIARSALWRRPTPSRRRCSVANARSSSRPSTPEAAEPVRFGCKRGGSRAAGGCGAADCRGDRGYS